MNGISEERRAVIIDRLLASPVAFRLQIELADAGAGEVRLSMPFAPANVTEGEMVHGGVIATLADVAAVSATVSAAPTVPTTGATANLSISFLSPAMGTALCATARVLRAGSRQHVVRVEVRADDMTQVAEALATVVLR